MELLCKVQSYHWGKKGENSLVAKLASSNSGLEIDVSKTYAELWMGIHPNAPSVLKHNNVLLSQHLSENPAELGSKVLNELGDQLPFLFKVLSIDIALSIQAHPTRSNAEKLFKESPDLYKDPNHKPELAIALTRFETLCGFRPQEEIKFFLKNVPELASVIDLGKMNRFLNSDVDSNESKEAFKDCFESLVKCDEAKIKNSLDNLLKRLNNLEELQKKEFLVDLVQRIHSQFPGDVGIFCIYFLNYLKLHPGEALYLAPNEPHAYLSGDCVECMSNSDNVVRVGLTPKFRDVSTLCEMLTYKHYRAKDVCFQPIVEDDFTKAFRPPINEFAVSRTDLPAYIDYELVRRPSASIVLVIEGQGVLNSNLQLKSGLILYIPSDGKCSVKTTEPTLLFQAFCNVD